MFLIDVKGSNFALKMVGCVRKFTLHKHYNNTIEHWATFNFIIVGPFIGLHLVMDEKEGGGVDKLSGVMYFGMNTKI